MLEQIRWSSPPGGTLTKIHPFKNIYGLCEVACHPARIVRPNLSRFKDLAVQRTRRSYRKTWSKNSKQRNTTSWMKRGRSSWQIDPHEERVPYLWDVKTMAWPLSLTREMVSQSCLRATGSIPVVGSSKKTMGGSPTKATAVLSFRLFPPLRARKITKIK